VSSELIVVGSGTLGLLLGLTINWLFWMTVWTEFWGSRIRRSWRAEVPGAVMGLLSTVSVPVAFVALAMLSMFGANSRRSRIAPRELP